MSRRVWSPEIARIADAHFGRRKDQPSPDELKAFYRKAGGLLSHEIIWFNGAERKLLAKAFGDVVRREGLTCYARAILSNHVHLLIRKHRLKAEDMCRAFKAAGRKALCDCAMAPHDHPVFSKDVCHMYKSDVPAMWNCISYIEANYTKHRVENEPCDFVTPYNGWPDHRRR